MTVIEFLRDKKILDPDKTKWLIIFENGEKIDLVELIDEYVKLNQRGK